MNKQTAELVSQLKDMIELKKHLEAMAKEKSENKEKLLVLHDYISYEIMRNISDIIVMEKL